MQITFKSLAFITDKFEVQKIAAKLFANAHMFEETLYSYSI